MKTTKKSLLIVATFGIGLFLSSCQKTESVTPDENKVALEKLSEVAHKSLTTANVCDWDIEPQNNALMGATNITQPVAMNVIFCGEANAVPNGIDNDWYIYKKALVPNPNTVLPNATFKNNTNSNMFVILRELNLNIVQQLVIPAGNNGLIPYGLFFTTQPVPMPFAGFSLAIRTQNTGAATYSFEL
jgi:hypothetical protein